MVIKAHKGTVVYDEPEGFSPESFDPVKQKTEEKKDTETKPFENPLIEPPKQISVPEDLEGMITNPALYDPASEVGNPTVPIKEPEKKNIFVAPENPFIEIPQQKEDIQGPSHPILLDNKSSIGLANPNTVTQPPLQRKQQYLQDFQKWKMLQAQTKEQNPQYQAIKLAGNKFQNAMQEELAPYRLKMQVAQKALEEGNMSFGDFMGMQQEVGIAAANAEQKHMGLQTQAKIALANFENNQLKAFNEQYKNLPTNTINTLKYNKGGMMEQQMSLFEEGGMKDDGLKKDPVSGNDIPPGSLAKEVRDDIPAQLSDGEYVVPADVVQYFGVKFFEDIRMEAKLGLKQMDETGRIGGEPVSMTMIALGEAEEKKKKALGGPIYASEGVLTDQQKINASKPSFNPADYSVLGFTPVSPIASVGGLTGGMTESKTYYHGETGESKVITLVNGVVTPPTDVQFTQPPDWSINKPTPTKVEEKKEDRSERKELNAKLRKEESDFAMSESAKRLGIPLKEYLTYSTGKRLAFASEEIKDIFGKEMDNKAIEKIRSTPDNEIKGIGGFVNNIISSFENSKLGEILGLNVAGQKVSEIVNETPPSVSDKDFYSGTEKSPGYEDRQKSDSVSTAVGQEISEKAKDKTADKNIEAGDYSFLNRGGLLQRPKRKKK